MGLDARRYRYGLVHTHCFELMAFCIRHHRRAAVSDRDRRAVGRTQGEQGKTRHEARRLRVQEGQILGMDFLDLGEPVFTQNGKRLGRQRQSTRTAHDTTPWSFVARPPPGGSMQSGTGIDANPASFMKAPREI
jgi:hypothetical protein